MPVLLKITYTDGKGKILRRMGPEELYIPDINSSENVNGKAVLNALEYELEEYDWSEHEIIDVRWIVISSSVH